MQINAILPVEAAEIYLCFIYLVNCLREKKEKEKKLQFSVTGVAPKRKSDDQCFIFLLL